MSRTVILYMILLLIALQTGNAFYMAGKLNDISAQLERSR